MNPFSLYLRDGRLITTVSTPFSLYLRDGRLRRNDQIISINGQSLEGIPHTEAVKMLQAARGVVELVILRDLVPSPPSPSTKHSPQIWQPPPPPTLTPPPPPPTEDQETVSENQMGIPSVRVTLCEGDTL